MWKEFLAFDLRYQMRQPLLWVVTVALVAIAFLTASNEAVQLGGSIGNVHMNAPVVIANQLSILSIIALFLVTAFIAGTILRDSEAGIADLLFATGMCKIDYLTGRFLAGITVCLLIFALITAAMMAGSGMPSIDPERLGAFSPRPYLWSFLVFVVPNLLFISALLMLLAATTRSMTLVYLGVLGFIALWSITGVLRARGGNDSLVVLLDPFGVHALAQATRYLSSAQKNVDLPALSGLLLANRALWTGIALALFGATLVLFKPLRAGSGSASLRKTSPGAVATLPAPPVQLRRVAPHFGAREVAAQFLATLAFDARGVLRSLPFAIMLLLAIANFFANYLIGGMRFDSTPYPLTRVMLEELAGGINAMLVIVLIFYSGELIFRERQANIAGLSDALPVPNWVPLLAKAGALVAVILAFLSVGALAGVAIQLLKGGAPIEVGLLVKGTLINATYFVLMAFGILALQTIVNNKYLGYLLGVGLFMLESALGSLGIEHRLFSFAALPPLTYSDMNGYGHFLEGWSWFALYWALCALAMLILAQAFWVRGAARGWRLRLRAGCGQLGGRAGLALASCLVAFAGTGAWIFYNTNILNAYLPDAAVLDAQADYEKLYRQYLAAPTPKITAIRASVDIYPAQRRVAIAGRYALKNATASDMAVLHIQTDTDARTRFTNLPAHTVILDDQRLGFKIIELARPLAPGASMDVDFTVAVDRPGFTNSGAPDTINHNGTLFASENFFPKFGYVQANEIQDRSARRQRGLGEPQRMPRLEDRAAHTANFWKLYGFDADRVDFETTVSTSADQIAIAPGTLQSSWTKDGRNYYHYKMDTPILPFFSFQSARWTVRKALWRGVAIEVYFDPKHGYNVDSMIKGSQRALDYFSAQFGPYPHKQVRITEFPLYQQYARSFPNVIPFSESLGFVNDLRDPDGVDHVFYVTAHELAHQWWGDQLIAANVQGSAMLTESLAEYSALMVLEREFGREKTRHILRFDLDQYLAGRSKELIEELPLARVEGQVYLQYRKGSKVFYRLREEMGEAALNRALKRFLDLHRYKSTPYPTSSDLLALIRAEAPQDKQALITDLFERIVFYDNRVTAAKASQRSDGRWDVTMTLSLAKSEADGKGKEAARAYDEAVDIAVFARAPGAAEKDERVLLHEKRRLPAGTSSLTVTVKDKPYEVGVDPYRLLIDRVAGDNRKPVDFD